MSDDAPKYAKTKTELAKYIPKEDQATGTMVEGISLTALANNWMTREDNPGKTPHGYNIKAWQAWVLSHLEQNPSNAAGRELQDLKIREQIANIRVQRDRAKESLRLERIKVDEAAGRLHNEAECDADRHRAASTLRARVDSWQQHQIAKHPSQREFIDGLCVSFLATLEGVE
jgi:hypothetical protein|tara:strand:- start:952 stop:1470 length:519 start_codon:yes stop_codon:yes gene_type:complete